VEGVATRKVVGEWVCSKAEIWGVGLVFAVEDVGPVKFTLSVSVLEHSPSTPNIVSSILLGVGFHSINESEEFR